jgi:hypothetical protein
MAEVKIDIRAKDEASPAFNSAHEGAARLLGKLREISSISLKKRISLNVSQALSAARSVKSAIDSIPDVSTKTVILRYQTQASPVRPFSEGIEYIKRKMESLPTGSDYTMRWAQAPLSSSQSVADNNFSPTINLTVSGSGAANTDGSSLARDIDRSLAELWRTNRSELRRAQSK